MATGLKTGGRTKGTPNKLTQTTRELLKSLDCDPIKGMAEIAQKAMEANDYELAGRMYKELAQYVTPKMRSQELVLDNQEGNNKKIEIEFV